MKPVIIAPLVALALAAGGAGAYVWVSSEGPAEEVSRPPSALDTPEPSPTATATPTATPSPTPTADWLTYTDPDFDFSFDYPPEFIVEDLGAKGGLPLGAEKILRVVEKGFIEGYPPGQVGFSVLVKDAATLDQWLSKHSRTTPVRGADEPISFFGVANTTEGSVQGKNALSFDWDASGTAIHAVIFFLPSHVLEADWYAADPAYEAKIHAVFDGILETYSD